MENMESCDFMTAVEILCKNANMEIPQSVASEEVFEKKNQKQKILEVLDCAYKYYEQNLYLKTSTVAQNYVKQRKLTKKALDTFKIGYSVNWSDLISHLEKSNFTIEDMKLAGLVEEKNGRPYDVFGERLMFPIFNIHDECIAFSARSLQPTTYAKYKNSTNSLVFDKSKNLYGINNLKLQKQQSNLKNIIIVEGQMDVISMWTNGFTNCVACLGTALTSTHAKQLGYICNNIIVCLDGDSAGQKATIKTIDVLLNANLTVKAVKIPNNLDPDDYIKQFGKESFQQILDSAVDGIEFQILHQAGLHNLQNTTEKAEFIKNALLIVKKVKSESVRQIYLEIIKKLTNVSIDVLSRESASDVAVSETQANVDVQNYATDAHTKACKFIVASLLCQKAYAENCVDLEKYVNSPTILKLYKLIKQYKNEGKRLMTSTLYDVFDMENSPVIAEIANYNFSETEENDNYFAECVWKLREEYLKQQMQTLNEKFSSCIDANEKREYLISINDISNKLRKRILED